MTHCPSGHELEPYITGGGNCRQCTKKIPRGQSVLDCAQCKWWVCAKCAGRSKDPTLVDGGDDYVLPPDPGYGDRCPRNHELMAYATTGGSCQRCNAFVKRRSLVYDCSYCRWWIYQLCVELGRTCAFPAVPAPQAAPQESPRKSLQLASLS